MSVRSYQLFIRDAHKERVRLEVMHHPLVQLLDVGDRVQHAVLANGVRVLGEETRAHDASTMVGLLEVWIREQDEHLAQLSERARERESETQCACVSEARASLGWLAG